MAEKLGKPPAGTRRKLTSNEVRLLQAPASWGVENDKWGVVWLVKPVGPKKRPMRVALPGGKYRWAREQLEAFWARDQRERGVYIAKPAAMQIRQLQMLLLTVLKEGNLPPALAHQVEIALGVPCRSTNKGEQK